MVLKDVENFFLSPPSLNGSTTCDICFYGGILHKTKFTRKNVVIKWRTQFAGAS